MPFFTSKKKQQGEQRPGSPQRPPKNNKERVALKEREAQDLQNKLAEVKSTLRKASSQREALPAQQEDLQKELRKAEEESSSRRADVAKIQAVVEQVQTTHRAALEELKAIDDACAAERQESAMLREKISRLTEKRAAFQLAQKDATAKRGHCIVESQSKEANDIADKRQEALQANLIEAVAKVVALEAERDTWKLERHKLLESLKLLKQEHEESRKNLTDLRSIVLRAAEENEELRRQVPAAKKKFEEVRQKVKTMAGKIADVELEAEKCALQIKAMSSTYDVETGLVKPMIGCTKVRKREADETHAARCIEIVTTVEARQRRRSKDATLDDVGPFSDAVDRNFDAPTLPKHILTPVVDHAPRDVMPTLKMKEMFKTDPMSTGIPVPNVFARSGQRVVEVYDRSAKSREACPSCGHVLMGDAVFCRHCGKRRDGFEVLDVDALPMLSQESCLKCGNVYMGDAEFCRKCGTRRMAGPSSR